MPPIRSHWTLWICGRELENFLDVRGGAKENRAFLLHLQKEIPALRVGETYSAEVNANWLALHQTNRFQPSLLEFQNPGTLDSAFDFEGSRVFEIGSRDSQHLPFS
jgi:hypothetical protein